MPVIEVAFDAGVVMVAVTGPLTCVHAPVPAEAVLPAIVAEPPVVQIVWSGPAFDVVGGVDTVIVT